MMLLYWGWNSDDNTDILHRMVWVQFLTWYWTRIESICSQPCIKKLSHIIMFLFSPLKIKKANFIGLINLINKYTFNMHDYVRLSCFATTHHFQNAIPCRITSVNLIPNRANHLGTFAWNMSKFFINWLGNNFAEVRLGGEILNSHVSMHIRPILDRKSVV